MTKTFCDICGREGAEYHFSWSCYTEDVLDSDDNDMDLCQECWTNIKDSLEPD